IVGDLHGFASDELRESCERAHALCLSVGTPKQLFQVLYALSHLHVASADIARTSDTVAQLDKLANQLGAEQRLLADTVLARSAMLSGRFTDSRRLAEGPLTVPLRGQVAARAPGYGVDPIVATNCQYALALWYLGDVQRARATIEASLAATDHPGTAAITRAAALCHMAVFAILCRDPSDARRHAGALLALTSEHEFHFWCALAKGLLGWVHVQDGDLRQGIETLMAARDEIAASGARILATYILAFLAEAHLCTRDLAAGLAAVDEGLHVAESSLDRSYWPELWRLKGELLLATAPPRRQRRTGPIRRDDR